jgi:serine protease
VQQITASPGAPASLVVSFAGDGSTKDSQVTLNFDESRLSLPVTSGTFSGAGANGGLCARSSSYAITVLVSATTGVLPTPATTICTIPFSVPTDAARGLAKVASVQSLCFSASGVSVACSAVAGGVLVNAPAAIAAPAQPLSTRIVVQLSTAQGTPSVALLTGYNFSSGQPRPLQSLNVGQIRSLSPLVPIRLGDAANYIINNPLSPEAELSRYFVVNYASIADADLGLAALRTDPYVVSANRAPVGRFFSAPDATLAKTAAQAPLEFSLQLPNFAKAITIDNNQYHRNQLNIPEAWNYAGGWGLVALADTGIAINHPDLRSFAPSSPGLVAYTGGNYIEALSFNEIAEQFGPDELSPEVTANNDCDALDGTLDGLMRPPFVGHGTHTSGLIAANATNGDEVEGSCTHCGIVMRKVLRLTCLGTAGITGLPDPIAPIPARLVTNTLGVQVFNASFGFGLPDNFTEWCSSTLATPDCPAIAAQLNRDVLLPAAAGNARTEINFPGEDIRVPAVGGTDVVGDIWDDSPGNNINCFSADECGTNFRISLANDWPEVVAPAKSVRSDFYPGKTWVPGLCSDSLGGGSSSDGIGLCTGTSMSSPEIAGIYGLLRSVNPLVRSGNVDTGPVLPGIRTLVNTTASRSQAGLPRDNRFGFGIVNAALAVKQLLGSVRGAVAKNRAIPLFGLYSPGAKDYAMVANPQLATALQIDQPAAYKTLNAGSGMIEGAIIPGYGAFPGVGVPQAPRARAYVLSTEYSPVAGATLTPLYLLERKRNYPIDCLVGQVGCNAENRDFILITQVNDLNFAVNAGYKFLGLQGYIYELCFNEPSCLPPGTEKLYLQCKTTDDDCAVFLQNEKAAFEAQGYTIPFKGGSTVLGYAYGTGNSDAAQGDLLPDAVEQVAGTNLNAADTDADGTRDDIEYPLAAIPISDPCTPGAGFCGVIADSIFANGFE